MYNDSHGRFSKRQVEIISGLVAGFSTTIFTHPLDLIKIRLQLSPELNTYRFKSLYDIIGKIDASASSDFSNYKQQNQGTGMKNALLSRYKFPHTFLQYYRGITPNLAGNIIGWSLYLTLYAEFKHHINLSSPTANYFTSSTSAGITTSLLTNPIWVLKTRILGTMKNEQGAYKSVLDGIVQMLKKEGILSFWKGTIPSMFLVFQASLQFTFYDNLKALQLEKKPPGETKLSTGEFIVSSAISKIFSTVAMYPTQVVKSRLQVYRATDKRKTIAEVCSDVWKNEGRWRGFYKGVGANMLRVVPATCITFVVYEKVKGLLLAL